MSYTTNFPHNRKRTVFVGGFGGEVDEKVLSLAFIPFGEIVGISIPMEYETGKHRGFGFVEFESAEDAAAAIDNMNDSELYGRTIRVNFARPPKVTERSSRPVWADDEWLKQYGHGGGEGAQPTADSSEDEDGAATTADGETAKKAAKPKLPRVFMGIKIGIRYIGRIVIELRTDVVPRTCENFRAYARESEDSATRTRNFIESFRNSCVRGDGTGGKSIYGTKFEDENFTLKHSMPGVVSMANCGKDTNGSQFFLLTAEASWLDNKHVVFGHVVEGMNIVLEQQGSQSGKPSMQVTIVECGEL
ncbi:Peptidyl-prolyl cis-trans isomerase E [Aphelenchoides fujianensis]|nr:Peptidyl-prolyl cis-trans isomerase E [Aphelenchoides fujianensis]